jgi:hypothetical protein
MASGQPDGLAVFHIYDSLFGGRSGLSRSRIKRSASHGKARGKKRTAL